MELGAGQYMVTIETQDGTFSEDLRLRMSDKGLKRDITVRKMPHLGPGESANVPTLLRIKED